MNSNGETVGVGKSGLQEALEAVRQRLVLLGDDKAKAHFGVENLRKPVLMLGLPGIGKTCGLLSVIDEVNKTVPEGKKFKLKKILLGQTLVGELQGMPVYDQKNSRAIRADSVDLPQVEKDGEYGVLFLDELTTADKAQIQPALGLTDNTRNIGEYTLPENWMVVAAGNGPDCANFVALDDMTISRFRTFDIEYDYKRDWRPWAHNHGVNDLIIAYLNFNPSACVSPQSDEMDKSGRQFPCPRTWTELSKDLEIQEYLGTPVKQERMQHFAQTYIGEATANEFAAFTAFQGKIEMTPEMILNGEVKKVKDVLQMEVFHLTLQATVKELKRRLAAEYDANGEYLDDSYKAVGNLFTWLLSLGDLMPDQTINGIRECQKEVPGVYEIVSDTDFSFYCPYFETWLKEHRAMLLALDTEA